MGTLLIVGLGNPGSQYERTRHNVGFRVIDLLAQRWGIVNYGNCFDAEMDKSRTHGRSVILLKPQTFMNLSGISVSACSKYHKIAPGNVWVVQDELDLPLGKLRIKLGGSSGGHNGIGSIITRIGSDAFVRFRLGIGRPAPPLTADNYVLQPFAAEEKPAIDAGVERTADAIEMALKEDVARAMNVYNA